MASPFEVVETADQGRSMVAKAPLVAGALVLAEPQFISGTWEEDNCIECEVAHGSSTCKKVLASYPAAIAKKLDEVLETLDIVNEELKDGEVLEGLDRQRAFVKCLCLVHQSNAEKKKKAKKANPKKREAEAGATSGDGSESKSSNVPLPLVPLFNLQPSNEAACLEYVKLLRKNKVLNACTLIPHNLSDEQVARLIGILNANSHEIDRGGSAIFLQASMMNHSCIPNCNFSTESSSGGGSGGIGGSELKVFTIRPVAAGEHLTIDYNDECYLPTQKRRAALEKSYGFVCNCAACVSDVENCRVFCCPACKEMVLFARQGKWKCSVCEKEVDPATQAAMLAAESEAESNPPTTTAEIDALLAKRVLHEQHYIFFFIMQEFAREFAAESSESLCRTSLNYWVKINACLERVLPPFHHAKVVALDNLAQVRVKLGDKQQASADFRKACDISRVITGENSASTAQLQALADNTPSSVRELQAFYRSHPTKP